MVTEKDLLKRHEHHEHRDYDISRSNVIRLSHLWWKKPINFAFPLKPPEQWDFRGWIHSYVKWWILTIVRSKGPFSSCWLCWISILQTQHILLPAIKLYDRHHQSSSSVTRTGSKWVALQYYSTDWRQLNNRDALGEVKWPEEGRLVTLIKKLEAQL